MEDDYQTTGAAILDPGLPPIFAWRLARGLEFDEKADELTHVGKDKLFYFGAWRSSLGN